MDSLGLKQQLHEHSLPMSVEYNRRIDECEAHTLTRDPDYNNRRQDAALLKLGAASC